MLYDYVKGFQTKTHHDLITIYKLNLKKPIEEAQLKINRRLYRIDLFDNFTNTAYEIQRDFFGKSFYSKVNELSKIMSVIIVHPIVHRNNVIKLYDGSITRKSYTYSLKNRDIYSFFEKLVSFKLPFIPGKIGFDVLFIKEQIWKDCIDKFSKNRNVNNLIKERNLMGIDNVIKLRTREDFLLLLPEKLPEHFTNKDVAEMLKIQGDRKRILRMAGCLTYCLCNLGILSKIGKRGKSNLFKITQKKQN